MNKAKLNKKIIAVINMNKEVLKLKEELKQIARQIKALEANKKMIEFVIKTDFSNF